MDWLVSFEEMVDDLELTITENLPAAHCLFQGRRRFVESDRAVVFLCSRPIQTVDDYVRWCCVFLEEGTECYRRMVLMHINQ